MSIFWVVVLLATLLIFACIATYRYSYKKGFNKGANWILSEWKKLDVELGEINDD